MGLSKFLKKNAGAFGALAGQFGGTYGQLAASGFGAVDARQQEKAAARAAADAQRALADEERRRATMMPTASGEVRSSPFSLFSSEGDLGSMLPKGVSPWILLAGAGALVLYLRRRR